MPISLNGLPKREHLTGEIRIAQLYKQGNAFLMFPLRIVYMKVAREQETVRILFSVPKRQFKHAVDRNRFKRLMREAYRLQKQTLCEQVSSQEYSLYIAFSVVSKELPTQEKVMIKMGKALEKISELIKCDE